MITSDSVKQAYKRYSNYYDILFGTIFHPGRQKAVDYLECQPGDRILEVGVGTGLSLSMYPNDVRLIGIDLSEDMLKKARQRVEENGLLHVEQIAQMDAQQMSFDENSFDKVVLMYVASVVPDVEKLFEEIRRVCKPGGKIVVLNHFENENLVIRKVESFIQPLAKYLGFNPEFPMEQFLEKTHLKVKEKVSVNFLDYWTVLVGENEKDLH